MQDLSHVKDIIILKLTLVKRENQTNQTIASQSHKKENMSLTKMIKTKPK